MWQTLLTTWHVILILGLVCALCVVWTLGQGQSPARQAFFSTSPDSDLQQMQQTMSTYHASAGLLFCEEGLEAEEAGHCGGSVGDCSPRCFEDLGDDSLSMSASTSDSQHSEGNPF